MTDLQQQVQGAIDRLVESGAERGLQVAVYRDGERVVDAVAGVADPGDSGFRKDTEGQGGTPDCGQIAVKASVGRHVLESYRRRQVETR